jgi:hypothetical protein
MLVTPLARTSPVAGRNRISSLAVRTRRAGRTGTAPPVGRLTHVWAPKYGGIHFVQGDDTARQKGTDVGTQAYTKALTYFNGTVIPLTS